MKTILIATKNIDKFNTTKGIFQKLGLQNYDYKSLTDYEIKGENEEIGSLQERAKQKITFALDSLAGSQNITQIVLIVGIDDGFYIPSQNLLTANSKELVDEILSGKFLNKGEIIEEVRSYVIFNLARKNYHYFESRLPLKFLGTNENVKRVEGSNPLKYLLTFEFESQPIAEHTQEEVDYIILKYIEEDFRTVLDHVIEELSSRQQRP